MLLHEIFSLFKSIDSLILEGFKDDMYRLYPDAKDDPAFNNAIKIYNSDENKIRDAVKKKITINGNVAKAIKDNFPDAPSFVSFIDNLSKELNQKAKESAEKQKQLEKSKSHQLKLKIGDEYRQIRAGKVEVSPTDYWMIPCHTFEQLHAAASRYTGNLPKMSNEKIESEYGIEVPEEATHYETEDTPEEFLEKMKKETRFFMAPSWCIAANQDYFDDYDLETSENEKPLCYVFISKKYPNVRFCVALGKNVDKINDISYKDKKIKATIINKIDLGEVRDPWQIGGDNVIKTGLEMMKLAFGSEIDKVIKDICHVSKRVKTMSFSELKDGSEVFRGVQNVPSISGSFDNLVCGDNMFTKSGFETIDCKFPVLKDGLSMFSACPYLSSINTDFSSLERASYMFKDCGSLSEFNGDLPNLWEASYMFLDCENLKKFNCRDLSKLISADCMFKRCALLEKFECNLPNLKHSSSMFAQCKSLETFIGDLSGMHRSSFMFADSNIKTFKSDLSVLDSGIKMFFNCKNLERFDTPLPNLTNGACMFSNCGKLEFRTPLPKLIDGESMFYGTQLDIEGIKIITESLRDVRELDNENQPAISLGIIPENDETRHYIQIAKDKGWKVWRQSI